jgi:DNA-3-methyladenine glycosylase
VRIGYSRGPAPRPASVGLLTVSQGSNKLLPRAFFDRTATEVAPDLLGCVFWSEGPGGRVAVRLTEVEAYEGSLDPASHSFRGRTARNAVMFGPPGHAYVYFTYGMHYCANLVCQRPGDATAVLLRAGQVIEGNALAAERRNGQSERDLARGPGRLCQALAIDRTLDGTDVCTVGSPLGIGPPLDRPDPAAIRTGPRVGITKAADRPLRFWLAGDRYVSAYKGNGPPPALGPTAS